MGCKQMDKQKQKHKRGLWSPNEDQKLKDYILKHGHGCWASVPINAGSDFEKRNRGATSLLDFSKYFELVTANSYFPQRKNHLVIFRSTIAKTQIDYLLLRKGDRRLCKNCKLTPSENLTIQHRLFCDGLED